MAVSCVHLEADAYMVCLTHALSTEREEVMGLLIGEVDEKRISHISAVIMLRRSDKQPDRVEISPEQLSDASTRAEDLARELQRPLRVLGWYHSHPHITVWPSHVDVRTQAMYQMMDEGFIGLIFSVFNEEKNTKNAGDMFPVSRTWSRPEEDEAYNKTLEKKDLDLITRMHNSSVYTKSLCQVMEVMSGPLIQTLENRLQSNKEKIQMLEEEKKRLQKQIEST
ncbi:hypothetical protein KUTeg_012309 [Tegillarca granosa]|uniref:MPN domain-containing protein n=1 Tax=Tegillarca granosa TaxID=220873 RepID=A0ABQ9EZ58_TEGGR|nr:hypothetical protein KUTeg_012309 [Tegillarca granosa]